MVVPWTEYLLGVVVLEAYQEFERRVGMVAEGRGTNTAMVLSVISRMQGDFSTLIECTSIKLEAWSMKPMQKAITSLEALRDSLVAGGEKEIIPLPSVRSGSAPF